MDFNVRPGQNVKKSRLPFPVEAYEMLKGKIDVLSVANYGCTGATFPVHLPLFLST